MPERVRIGFDDDGTAVSSANTRLSLENTTALPRQGTKRKRVEAFKQTASNVAPQEPKTRSLKACGKQDKLSLSDQSPRATAPRNGTNGNHKTTYRQKEQDNRQDRTHVVDTRHLISLSEKRKILAEARKQLPIGPHAERIRQGLRGAKDVMLLVGETGSGKSTQVPQFLLDEPWCEKCIAITQPRRVAAISLARRVADEMGTPLGASSPASKVGYSVRFDVSTSPSTKIKFLTEGMLLQEMLRDPWLRQYSAVIVDEVHERSVNVDLILGFLRNLVSGDQKGRKGKSLKVVVMSATADVDSLFNFFDHAYQRVPAQSNGVNLDEVDDSEESWAGITSEDEHSSPEKTKHTNTAVDMEPLTEKELAIERLGAMSDRITVSYIKGRQYQVKTQYLSQPTEDFVEAALKAVFKLHTQEPLPGDILVFLTGQDTVESLERLINEYAATMDPKYPRILTLPLFAALSQVAQQRVFQQAPPRTRKIILSTNIAETSVTVSGVRYVVDSGKVKVKQFRNRLGLDSLLVKPVSQSSAVQREGRAGREAPGKCHRLYTESDFRALQKDTTPEILRCDLAQAILAMKARGIDDVVNFPFLDPPPRESLEKALLQLLQLGTLNDFGMISEIGHKIAKLPLSPALGRVLVEASQSDKDCLADMIDIVACLSVENIFLNLITEEKKEEAEAARRELYRRDGDHLTMLSAVKAYAAEHADRRAWSAKYFVSHRAMQNVMDTRKQLLAQCKQLGLLTSGIPMETSDTAHNESHNAAILQSLLRGFAPNTARLMPDGNYRTLLGNQTVSIHPSSVLFGKKVEAIVFSEFVFTNKSYGRSVSAVRLGWIDEVLATL